MQTTDILKRESLQYIMGALVDAGYQAYLVGGCVRDVLMGLPMADIDISTSATPDEVYEVFTGTRALLHPTGVDHGTWTVVYKGDAYEVTSFRKDVATDGRRATVTYADTMEEDAQRRDFTMNAMYMDASGKVYDPTGEGMQDIIRRQVRFIGDADERCKEDYLRILRLFRFHAKYGKGPLDADAFHASQRNSSGLEKVSGERIWSELKKLLSLHDPVDSLLEMERTGVLEQVLPQHAHISGITNVVIVERILGLSPGWGRRYVALTGYYCAEIPFPCTNLDTKHVQSLVTHWKAGATPAVAAYRAQSERVATDCVVLYHASLGTTPPPVWYAEVTMGLSVVLPVTAKDFMDAGVRPGMELGVLLGEAKRQFIRGGFKGTKEQILKLSFENVRKSEVSEL